VRHSLPATRVAMPFVATPKTSHRIVRRACSQPRSSGPYVATRNSESDVGIGRYEDSDSQILDLEAWREQQRSPRTNSSHRTPKSKKDVNFRLEKKWKKWAVLGAAAKRGDYGQASRMHAELKTIGGVDNLLTNSQIIAAASKTGNLKAAEAWFNTIEEPDLVAYSSVLAAAAARGKMDAVETWFDRLRHARFSPNLVVYNTVISGAAKAGNLKAAEYWFHKMQREGLEGDVPTYGSLIHAAKNCNNRSAAVHWYREMIHAGLEPHLMAYCSLISVSKDVAAARLWLHEIQAHGLQANNVVYNALMNLHASRKDSQGAMNILQEMESARVTPQATEYNCLMNSYMEWGLSGANGAYDAYKRMLANGVEPNFITLTTLRKAVGKTRFWAMRVSDLIVGPIEELD